MRSRAFGLISAMFAAGMVFGPLGGGMLYARYGFAVPFFVAAALQFVTLARHDRRCCRNPRTARKRKSALPSRDIWRVSGNRTWPASLAEACDRAGSLRMVCSLLRSTFSDSSAFRYRRRIISFRSSRFSTSS